MNISHISLFGLLSTSLLASPAFAVENHIESTSAKPDIHLSCSFGLSGKHGYFEFLKTKLNFNADDLARQSDLAYAQHPEKSFFEKSETGTDEFRSVSSRLNFESYGNGAIRVLFNAFVAGSTQQITFLWRPKADAALISLHGETFGSFFESFIDFPGGVKLQGGKEKFRGGALRCATYEPYE